MQRPTAWCSHRFREKASVFLTELHPADTAQARNSILGRLRKRDFDASHHCAAWREGPATGAWGVDDDGEPAGTAGGPMLRVLEGEGLVETLVVCIRWFGGTKLGKGGLVRAYTEGAQGVVAQARALGLLEEVKLWVHGAIRVPPAQAHLPFAVLGAFPGVEILGQDFAPEGANLRFRMGEGHCRELEDAWREKSRGGQVLWS
jgi:putative IMPACT (imprinted ancient) family translation regulator